MFKKYFALSLLKMVTEKGATFSVKLKFVNDVGHYT